ncbi:MAG: antitoxin VapB family protein [Thermoplasmataceae archaeon]
MKSIKIGDKTYNKLKEMRREKSFSKFLSCIAGYVQIGSKGNIKKFCGISSDDEAAAWETAIGESRSNTKERM